MNGLLEPLLCALTMTIAYGWARSAWGEPRCPRCESSLTHYPGPKVWRCNGCSYARRATE